MLCEAVLCCCFCNVFCEVRAKKQIIFLPNKQIWKNVFINNISSTNIFPSSILKINLCTSRRTQLQQCLEMMVYFELILFVYIDVLRRCQHFFSHVATFPCQSRLNQYLAENKVSFMHQTSMYPDPHLN